MKRLIKTILLVFGLTITGLAQSLSDSVFISQFDSVEINLSKIRPVKKYSNWNLIAGYCKATDKDYSELKKKQIKDSLNNVRQIRVNFLGEWLDSCYTNCDEKYLSNKKSQNDCQIYCDSVYDSEYYLSKEKSLKTFHQLVYYIDYEIVEHYKFGKKQRRLENYFKKTDLCSLSGFGTWCPPNGCNWFLISTNKNGLHKIDTYDKLCEFVGHLDNPSDGFLMLIASELAPSNGYPDLKTILICREIDSDFYFIINIGLSDCPMETYRCLVKVTENRKAEIIDKILIDKDDTCI